MFTTEFFASIVTTALLTTATVAEAADLAAPAPMPVPTASAAPLMANRNLAQRYCIVDEVPASRILRRNCATLAEWQVLGVEPRKMPRR
jgi:hypothetical protein